MASEVLPYAALRSAPRLPLAGQLPLAGPWSMYVETTNVCNFRCRFCPESFADYKEQSGGLHRMSMELFQKLAGDIEAAGGLKVLRFYMMGEPLSHPELPEMIRYATERNLAQRTELTTNGTLLNEDRARRLITSGLTYLRVSVYSVDAARHAHVTQSKISIERIRENVQRFRELRDAAGQTTPRLYVKIIDTFGPENDTFRAMYTDIADEVEIETPMNWNDYDGRDLLSEAYGDGAPSEAAHEAVATQRREVCTFPFYTLVVHSSGDVSVCCVDWNKQTVVGNIRDSSLLAIWRGERLREFQRMHLERRRHENVSCKSCTFLHTAPDNLDAMPTHEHATILHPLHRGVKP